MTIFYFTSTGNCLAVAKKIGIGNTKLISIPQVVGKPDLAFADDVIGVVFPIYGFGLPKMVKKFLETAKLQGAYMFAIGTYGNLPGACMMNVQRLAEQHGYKVDYAESLLMVDNYLPGFNINDQVAKLPEKHVDENLARIIADIQNRKTLDATVGIGWRFMTAMIKRGENLLVNGKQGQRYEVNQNCNQCGTCSKVCPAGNITVHDKVIFADQCEGCLGCVHLCPKNAIHLRHEKNAVRWRNPDVSLKEMIAANNRK